MYTQSTGNWKKLFLYGKLAALVCAVTLTPSCGNHQDDPAKEIAIAAVGPLTGPAADRGKDLERAVQMAVAEANAAGGLNGKRVRLTIYDDGDQPARASEWARQIAETTPAVAVLGQVASSAALAAGQVYQAEQIPAITGAASAAGVTKANNWYFRMLQDAEGQGRFLADYARYRFQARDIAVLREKGTAGEEFATAFRDRAKTQRIKIAADLEFAPSQAADPKCMAGILQKLARIPKGTIVVLGTQYAETPEVLRALRDGLGPFIAMGYSSVATEGLSQQLAKAETDRHPPGFYTSGLIVAAPQLPDVAEYAQTVFASRYLERYGVDPNPEAVRWYESAQLIFQAVRAKQINGTDRATARRGIRDWLASRDRPEAAAAGTSGPIYFDTNHNVHRGISIGLFHDGKLISAPVQFTLVTDPDQVPGWDRLLAGNMVIDAGGTKIVKTPVVYAGIDLNSLDNIDVRAGTFAADFFLWFRYQDDSSLDVHEVEFPTAVSGAQLGKEVWRRTADGFTTSTYHVKGVFRADYEFSRFPFDRQMLKIPVQVRNSTSYTLNLAYGGARSGKANSGASPLASKLWLLQKQLFFRDVVSYQSEAFGNQAAGSLAGIQYNRINAAITIKRDVFGFAVKNFLPLLCILVAVLVGYSIGPDVINPRISVGVTALLTTSVLYQKLASDLPSVTYIIAMDYVFFGFFGFCVLFLSLSVVTYETHKLKKHQLTVLLNRGGAALTFLSLLTILAFVWVRFWSQSAPV
jgi:ABC-type branched-subunit amino acid transport system substrate-binding protein